MNLVQPGEEFQGKWHRLSVSRRLQGPDRKQEERWQDLKNEENTFQLLLFIRYS